MPVLVPAAAEVEVRVRSAGRVDVAAEVVVVVAEARVASTGLVAAPCGSLRDLRAVRSFALAATPFFDLPLVTSPRASRLRFWAAASRVLRPLVTAAAVVASLRMSLTGWASSPSFVVRLPARVSFLVAFSSGSARVRRVPRLCRRREWPLVVVCGSAGHSQGFGTWGRRRWWG